MIDYKNTLNLPKTKFPMKANLSKKELDILNKWNKKDLYKLVYEKKLGKKKFVLHDGPPYANGKIHIGHSVNKILKDIIIKSKNLYGFNSHYLPGWDCHGLPIEHKIEKIISSSINKFSLNDFCKKCREFAKKQVEDQKLDFIRMGILGNWSNAYLTMDYKIEANIIRVLGKIIENNYLVSGFKPVHWCVKCNSSLAEAEVEYYNRSLYSIYFCFYSSKNKEIYDKFHTDFINLSVFLVVWTTTPWTLPANRAVAVNPNLKYQLIKVKDRCFIIEKLFFKKFIEDLNITKYDILGECKGINLELLSFNHPFMNFKVPIVLSNHVNSNIGSGLVHIAPDHGIEDYVISNKYNLSIANLVTCDGYYKKGTHTKLDNVFVLNADKLIIDILIKKKLFLYKEKINHNYPFCWRHKFPIIFLSTRQWFINMENNNLRKNLLKEIEKIKWIPDYGKDKIKFMIKNRPDWCVSRQRKWGVPMTLFIHKKTKQLHPKMVDLIKKIAIYIEKFGSSSWWNLNKLYFLSKEDANIYKKVKDTLDVWFDSGSTNISVIDYYNKNHNCNIDLYLEGIDQYRGWFMSSLILSVAIKKKVPSKCIISHGFVVDSNGKKMSKSLGNTISPQKIIKEFGADILRLWVASNNYKKEITISHEILKRITEIYRRIRNTIRFLLANLNGFDFFSHSIKKENMILLDYLAVSKAKEVQNKIIKYYSNYDFSSVVKSLMYFCSVDMGSFYLNIIKDRQYTSKTGSLPHRSCQTAMFHIIEALVRWISPILSFTSDEVWSYLKGDREKCIFLEEYYDGLFDIDSKKKISNNFWDKILMIKCEVNRFLEEARLRNIFSNSLESELILYADKKYFDILNVLKNELHFLFLTSKASIMDIKLAPNDHINTGIEGLKIFIKKASGKKCLRCWHYTEIFCNKVEHERLCLRCFNNIFGKGEVRKYI